MGAPAGYGREVCHAQAGHSGFAITRHDGIMDAKDTVCQVAMLSIRSEDMLAYYTADQFATGFKKRPAFELRGITWNSGSSCEGIWITKRQPGSSCPSPDVMAFGLEGHAMQGGHIEHRLGGHARTIHHRGVCDWLQEVVGFPAGRHQAEQSPVRRGHLDHQSATWQLIHFTRRVGVDGLEGHALQGGHVEHRCGGHARTHHHGGWFQEDAGFPTVRHQAEQRLIRRGHLDHHKVCVTLEFVAGFMLAFQLSGIKQNRGSSGEGVWIIKRKFLQRGVMHRR